MSYVVLADTAPEMLEDGVLNILAAAGFPVVRASDPSPPSDGTIRAFDGQVPGPSPAAFVVVNQRIPNVTSRSEARSRLAHRCHVMATVTAPTAQGVREIARGVLAALEGARVLASGWQTGPIALINTRAPVEDRDVNPGTGGRYPMFAVLELDYTATLA